MRLFRARQSALERQLQSITACMAAVASSSPETQVAQLDKLADELMTCRDEVMKRHLNN